MIGFLEKLKRNYYMNSCVSVLDNKQVLIENCKTILECNDILVRIVSSGFLIEIWGKDLTANNYSSKNVSVNGEIQSISLTRRSKGK